MSFILWKLKLLTYCNGENQTPSKKEDTKSEDNSQKNEQSDSSSNTPTTEAGVSANNGAS